MKQDLLLQTAPELDTPRRPRLICAHPEVSSLALRDLLLAVLHHQPHHHGDLHGGSFSILLPQLHWGHRSMSTGTFRTLHSGAGWLARGVSELSFTMSPPRQHILHPDKMPDASFSIQRQPLPVSAEQTGAERSRGCQEPFGFKLIPDPQLRRR